MNPSHEEVAFAQWMRLVDRNIDRLVGLTSGDLPDWGYRDAHDDDLMPVEAARLALRDGGWEL